MKVLNVLEEGRWGGPQRRVLLVALELKKFNVETIVVLPKNKTEALQKKLKDGNIAFYAIDLHRITKDKRHLFNYIFCFRKEINQLIKIIRQEKIDIVHTNGSFQFKGVIAANKTGSKNVWHLNDTYVAKPIKVLFDKYLAHKSNGFFVAGNRVNNYYLQGKIINAPVVRITPPVDTATFDPNKITSPALESYAGLKVTLVANWSQIKGHETFIRMAHEVSKQLSDIEVKFFIVGKFIDNQKKYFDFIQKLISDLNLNNLHLLGQRDDIPAILKNTDISICSSHYEASPTVVWEAMSMANPVISTDVGDVKSILEQYQCGYCVDVQDFKMMAEHTIKLLKNDTLRIEYGEKARDAAIRNFALKSVASRHLELYRNVLNQVEM